MCGADFSTQARIFIAPGAPANAPTDPVLLEIGQRYEVRVDFSCRLVRGSSATADIGKQNAIPINPAAPLVFVADIETVRFVAATSADVVVAVRKEVNRGE